MGTNFQRRKEAKRQKLYMYLVGGFMIMLMATLSFGYIQFSDQEEAVGGITEYDHVFSPMPSGGYSAVFLDQRVSFAVLPSAVEDVPVEDFSFSSGRVYLATDPADALETDFSYQRGYAFLQFVGNSVQPSCSTEEGCGDIPIVSCDEGREVVLFDSTAAYGISSRGSCVVLGYSSDYERAQVVDRFIYELLGVM